MNPYLARLRRQFEELRSAILAIQTNAANDGENGRDLTEDELRSIENMNEQAQALLPQIEQLTAIEVRNRQVAGLAAQVDEAGTGDADGGDQHRGAGDAGAQPLTGTAQTQDRDPGHYRQGGEFSFFGDMYRSTQLRDDRATGRLTEHSRALATGVAGAGIVPPKWLVDEFELLARQGRKLANAVRNVSIAGDPRPITIPKQTAGVDAEVTEQATENTAVEMDDAWASSVDTIVPKPTAGAQNFSRQMLDMSNPAIDTLIYGDLIAAYNLKVEKAVGAAMVTAAGTPVATFATEAAFTGTPPATPAIDAIIDAEVAVRDGRKSPADLIAMGTSRYGKFLKLKDNTGRPLINRENHGPMNVVGIGEVQTDGELEGLGVIVTEGVSVGTYPESIIVARAVDTILFEGDIMRFRYEEVSGPQTIRIGIWCYTAVTVRYAATGSVKRIQVTASV